MAITGDLSTPLPAYGSGSSGGAAATEAFSPPQSLLLAKVTVRYQGATAPSVSVSDTGGLSWSQVAASAAYNGTHCEIWEAYAPEPYGTVVSALSPYAWWRLSDAAGTATEPDSSGNGHTAAVTGVVFAAGQDPVSPGLTCASFNGGNACLLSSLNPSGWSALSAGVWVNMNGQYPGGSDSPRLIANSNGANEGFELGITGGQQPFWRVGNGTSNATVVGATVVPATGWVFLTGTWDGTTARLYMDGTLQATAALTGTLAAGPNDVYAGYGTDGNYYTGLLAEAQLYNYALTVNEVEALATVPFTVVTATDAAAHACTVGLNLEVLDNANPVQAGAATAVTGATNNQPWGTVAPTTQFSRVFTCACLDAIEATATPYVSYSMLAGYQDTTAPVVFSSGWGTYTGAGYSGGSEHASTGAGDTCTFTFTGKEVQWYGDTNSDHGIATVSVDGGAPVPVDSYSASSVTQVLLFDSGLLEYGNHVIVITNTGTHDGSSTGTYTGVDFFMVDQSPGTSDSSLTSYTLTEDLYQGNVNAGTHLSGRWRDSTAQGTGPYGSLELGWTVPLGADWTWAAAEVLSADVSIVSSDSGSGSDATPAATVAAQVPSADAGTGNEAVSAAPGAYNQAVAALSPSAWWKLADAPGSATAADSSGHGYNGTATAVTFGANGPVSGMPSALGNGSTSAIATAFNPSGVTALSLEAWVNFAGVSPPGARIFENASPSASQDGYSFFVTGATLYLDMAVGTTSVRTAGGTVPASGWVHVAATWNGSTVVTYVNGVQVATNALAGTLGAGSNGTWVGGGSGLGPDLSGYLAEAAIYPVVLTGAQVLAHYSMLANPASGYSASGTGAVAHVGSADNGFGSDVTSSISRKWTDVGSADAGTGSDATAHGPLTLRLSSADYGSGRDSNTGPAQKPGQVFYFDLLVQEGFSFDRAAVLGASGAENGQLYAAQSVTIAPQLTFSDMQADDWEYGTWTQMDKATITVVNGFIPFSVLSQLNGTSVASSGSGSSEYYALPLWTQYQHNNPAVPLALRMSSRNADGYVRTLTFVLYKVQLAVLDFTGTEYKTGLQASYSGTVLFSSYDERGNALHSGPEIGRLVSAGDVETGAFAPQMFAGT